jgi:peptidoglycan/LPS O-acetylase OafA/YrhL
VTNSNVRSASIAPTHTPDSDRLRGYDPTLSRPRTPSEPAYRPDIDGLRAYALTTVLLYHTFPLLLPGGFYGPDMFFVISGFLITSIILKSMANGNFSFLEFYNRRIRRIFPSLIVVLAATLVAGWIFMSPPELRMLGRQTAGASAFAANILNYFETGYFDALADTKPLLHLWSLGNEEQFYLAWPLLVLGATRLKGKASAVILSVLGLSFVFCLWQTRNNMSAAFYLPFSRAWEIMLGSGLAYYVRQRKTPLAPATRNMLSAAGALLLIGGLAFLSAEQPFPGWRALIPTFGTLFLIAAGPTPLINRALSVRPLVFIGLISYPLYLWHWPILVFWRIIIAEELPTWASLVGLAASVVMGWITYELVEARVRRSPRRHLALSLCAAMVVVAIAGGTIAAKKGVPSRLSTEARRIYEYPLFGENVSAAWRRHRCMLEKEGTYAAECVDASPADAPLIMLWGDSHAAAVYPGLSVLAGGKPARFAQFTMSRCPPMLGFVSKRERLYNPLCLAANDTVLSRIRTLRPAVVVLEGWWDIFDVNALPGTIDSLRATGVQRVVVLGNVPAWKGAPDRALFHLYQRAGGTQVPTRAPLSAFRALPVKSDAEVRAIAEAKGATFVSLLDEMCDATTCLAFTPEGAAYTNADHLAPPAARWVMTRVQSRLNVR